MYDKSHRRCRKDPEICIEELVYIYTKSMEIKILIFGQLKVETSSNDSLCKQDDG